ncbi:hypothetical protein SAMN02799624_02217 [Paenibacillus sp. UNC496MF]|uniref:hypothetical protein n=1 Tax=Paenibacillus sp. UNC496MF TaxID=1502753 RepID=UPI0008E76787|nr:hypothetical protein [Paenibacillus sp. UNC496MF]SFI79353.1 hypothetical protein SAMN02799624_02217 [Paenibacillus sp. UNC496MF]
MNKEQTPFYCLGCRAFPDREEAARTFRTGFYRVIHPLGMCRSCAAGQAKSAEEGTSGHRAFGTDGKQGTAPFRFEPPVPDRRETRDLAATAGMVVA